MNMHLSGKVIVLDTREVRDLGPTPVRVKPGTVLPLREVVPNLAAGEQLAGYSDSDQVSEVVRTWAKASLATLKALKLAALAERRWLSETGGIMLGGVPVRTDRESSAILTAAYVKASADANFTITNWKVATGVFATLDAASIVAIADAVTAHVQSCFDREADLTAEIVAAADAAALSAISIEVGWPA